MEVQINEIASTVRAVDGEALLTPRTMENILRAVMRALEEREAHQQRVHAEQRVSRGVSHELEE